MLAGQVLLANHIVKFFHRVFYTVMYISTIWTYAQALVRRISFAATLLAHQFLPAPTIVMHIRIAVGARFIHRDEICTDFQKLLTRIHTLIPNTSCDLRSWPQTHSVVLLPRGIY